MQRRTCLFAGRVQGVGFRYTVQNLALQYNLLGYVRNLPDGRVEVVMEGENGEMDRLLEEIKQRMEGFIRETTVQESPGTGEFRRFCIKH